MPPEEATSAAPRGAPRTTANASSRGSVPSAGGAEGLRERKKRATRRALRRAALSLVAERGMDGVTTDEIAAAADVSQRTFFNYFASKEDALVGVDAELVAALGRQLAERPSHEAPLEALRAVFIQYAETVSIDKETWELRLRVAEANPSLLPALLGASAAMEAMLTSVIAARTGTDPVRDPYPVLVANVATAAGRTALQSCGAGDFTRPFADVVAEVFDALIAGLPAPSQG